LRVLSSVMLLCTDTVYCNCACTTEVYKIFLIGLLSELRNMITDGPYYRSCGNEAEIIKGIM